MRLLDRAGLVQGDVVQDHDAGPLAIAGEVCCRKPTQSSLFQGRGTHQVRGWVGAMPGVARAASPFMRGHWRYS